MNEDATPKVYIIADNVAVELEYTYMIGCWEFGERDFKSVVIPEGITIIRQEAFRGCSSLESIVIPNSITEISYDAFIGCDNLKIKWGDAFIEQDGVIYNSDKTKIIFADNPVNVILPDTVTEIPSKQFKNCASLISVVIPDSVTKIGYSAFAICPSLRDIIIPESVTEIGSGMLVYCTSLNSVVIPENITEIGVSFFRGCTSLKSLIIPKSVTSIGWMAFKECSSLESIIVPESVTEIDNYAFGDCTSLKYIEIPKGLTRISCEMFENCTSLESIEMPKHITTIGSSAFKGCTSLKSIIIPETVTEIGFRAFENCTSLKSIVIPESINLIGNDAFRGCDNLEIIWNDVFYLQDGVVYNSDKTRIVHLINPVNVVLPETFTEIPSDRFRDWYSLKSIVIPETVIKIGDCAFRNCRSLNSVTLYEGLIEIDFGAFHGCTSLRNITIPSTVKTIGSLAFSVFGNYFSTPMPQLDITFLGGTNKIDGIVYNDDYTSIFYVTKEIKDHIIIHEEATTLGYMLNDHPTLKFVDISNTKIDKLNQNDFIGCDELTDLIVPERLRHYFEKPIDEDEDTFDDYKVILNEECKVTFV